jgi:hypothetical protein
MLISAFFSKNLFWLRFFFLPIGDASSLNEPSVAAVLTLTLRVCCTKEEDDATESLELLSSEVAESSEYLESELAPKNSSSLSAFDVRWST